MKLWYKPQLAWLCPVFFFYFEYLFLQITSLQYSVIQMVINKSKLEFSKTVSINLALFLFKLLAKPLEMFFFSYR